MFLAPDRAFAGVISQLIDCNPFLPERIQLERRALGKQFSETDAQWNLHPSAYRRSENARRITERAEQVLSRTRSQLLTQKSLTNEEQSLYCDLVYYVLFSRFRDDFQHLMSTGGNGVADVYRRFRHDMQEAFAAPVISEDIRNESPHLFSILYQLFSAFHNVFDNLIGSSPPIIQLRAETWRSIFTHDLRRYRKTLYGEMSDFTTLITGPSGSGKELVARAIGLSSYIRYDERRECFASSHAEMFCSLNLSALSPTLIESELFGHKRGAFTGAVTDRKGWLESCPPCGAIFLDEIGELDASIQVKLLRVLQEREFQRLGESVPCQFVGKIITATNRCLEEEMAKGRFRRDFFYRICSDRIRMPTLAQRCAAESAELAHLVQYLLSRIIGTEDDALTTAILEWIDAHLGSRYAWPGNVRELEQCIRSWLIRRDYQPTTSGTPEGKYRGLCEALAEAGLSVDELISLYCTVKYAQAPSYQAVAEQLGIDRRTVKARIDENGLERLRQGGS